MGAPSFLVFTSIVSWAIAVSVAPITTASDNNLFFISRIPYYIILLDGSDAATTEAIAGKVAVMHINI